MPRLETTLWVDTPAFEPWMLDTVVTWADARTYPNAVRYVDEDNRASAVKALQEPPANPGSTAYVLTSVPHRRWWSCLPPWVHVMARNEDNSPPSCTPEAWAYHWLGGRPWQSAKDWCKKPPKKKDLVELAASALEMWDGLPPWSGRVEHLYPPIELDYTMVADLPGSLADYEGVLVGCDIETTGLNPYRDCILGVSISVRDGQGWWIPFEQCGTMNQHPHTVEEAAAEGSNRGDSTVALPALFHIPPAKCPPVLRAVLESPAVLKVTHNGGFDWNFLDLHGVHMSPPAGDSKVLAYLLGLWPLSAGLTLKELASRLLRRPVITYGDATGDEDTLATVDPAVLTTYAAQDADVCRALWLYLMERIDKV